MIYKFIKFFRRKNPEISMGQFYCNMEKAFEECQSEQDLKDTITWINSWTDEEKIDIHPDYLRGGFLALNEYTVTADAIDRFGIHLRIQEFGYKAYCRLRERDLLNAEGAGI